MAVVLKPPLGLNNSPSLAFGSNVRIDWTRAPRGLKTFFLNSSEQLPDLCGAKVSYNGIPGVGMTAAGPAFNPLIGTNPSAWVPTAVPGPSQCSVEVFIYYKSGETPSAYCRVNENLPNSGTFDRALEVDATFHPTFYIFDGAAKRVFSSLALTAGNFYHIVGTSTGSAINIYVNGVSTGTLATSNGGFTGFTSPIFSQGWGDSADGIRGLTNSLLHCAFADKAWTADEVMARYLDMYGFLVPAEGEMPALNAPSVVTPSFVQGSNENFNVRQLATRAAAAILCATQATQFAVPPSVTPAQTSGPFGWHQQLSKPVPVARAVPTLPTQFAAPYQNTIPGIAWHRWQDPINGGVRNARAQPTQTTQFAVPASSGVLTPKQFGWYSPLSKSAPVAQAKPGNTFVPLNTAQIVISPQTVPLNYDAHSTQTRIVYYQSSFHVLRPIPVTPNTITGMGWFQPLGIPAPVAQAKPGSTFVPFNTRQVNNITGIAWHQPLGTVPWVARAQPGTTFVPFNTLQVNTITGMGWYQPLSRSAPVAIAQQGYTFVPFNTPQITVQVSFDPFVKKKHVSKRRRLEDDLLRQELEIKYKRRLAIEEAFWPPTTYELPPYKLPEHVKPAPDVSDLANVIMQVQQMRAAQAKQQDEEDEKALLELLKREYGIEDV